MLYPAPTTRLSLSIVLVLLLSLAASPAPRGNRAIAPAASAPTGTLAANSGPARVLTGGANSITGRGVAIDPDGLS